MVISSRYITLILERIKCMLCLITDILLKKARFGVLTFSLIFKTSLKKYNHRLILVYTNSIIEYYFLRFILTRTGFNMYQVTICMRKKYLPKNLSISELQVRITVCLNQLMSKYLFLPVYSVWLKLQQQRFSMLWQINTKMFNSKKKKRWQNTA